MPGAELGSWHMEINSQGKPCLCAHSKQTIRPTALYKALSPPLLPDPPQNSLRQGWGDVIKNLILQLRKLRLGDVTELLKFFPHQSTC